MSKNNQTIDEIIEMVNTLPDDTIDELLGVVETYTVDEAIDEVVKQAREHGEIVRDEKDE